MSTDRAIKLKYLNKNLPGSYSGLTTFVKTNNFKDQEKIKRILSGIDAYTLHRPIKKKIRTRPTLTFFPFMSMAADLMQMSKKVTQQEKFGYVLLVIDMFSRFLFAEICKDKEDTTVLASLKRIFLKAGSFAIIFKSTFQRFPHFILADRGKEFFNKLMDTYLKQHQVHLYSVRTPRKASQVERVIQTIRKTMARIQEAKPGTTIKSIVATSVSNYNNRYHSTLKMSPTEALKPENKAQVFINVYDKIIRAKPEKPKFKVGDLVRVARTRLVFEKSTKQGYKNQIFKIRKVVIAHPPFYYLSDLKGQEVIGSFVGDELGQVNISTQ